MKTYIHTRKQSLRGLCGSQKPHASQLLRACLERDKHPISLPATWFDPTLDECLVASGGARRRRRQHTLLVRLTVPGTRRGSRLVHGVRTAAQQFMAARMWYADVDPAIAQQPGSELVAMYAHVVGAYFSKKCKAWDCFPLESVALHELFDEAIVLRARNSVA